MAVTNPAPLFRSRVVSMIGCARVPSFGRLCRQHGEFARQISSRGKAAARPAKGRVQLFKPAGRKKLNGRAGHFLLKMVGIWVCTFIDGQGAATVGTLCLVLAL